MQLRLRLALTFGLLSALIMAVMGTFLYFTMERTLDQEMDRRLRVRADEVQFAIWPGPDYPAADLRANLDLSPLAEFDAPGLYVQVFDRSANLIAESDNLHGSTLPLNPVNFNSALNRRPVFANLQAPSGANVRVLSVPVVVQNQEVAGVLRVSQSREPLDETLTRLRLLLVVLGVVALLVAVAAGWLVAYRGLRPLALISQQADAIAADRDFTRRLRLTRRSDEVGRLAQTIDALLQTVDDTLRSHREFLADTSHELRNPLLAIRTNLDLLDRVPNDEDRAECLREAVQQTQRMSRLVSDLLVLAQVERGLVIEPRDFDLVALVREIGREEPAHDACFDVEVLANEALLVKADERRVRQIVTNLLDNAFKHTPAGGTVQLALSHRPGWACITVTDTGTGIPPQHLERIFERSYRFGSTARDQRSSYGLGLSIVKYLTEAHDGRVEVRSTPGRGSTFSIWLPALEANQRDGERLGPGVRMGETSLNGEQRKLITVSADRPRHPAG
ncbi:MAG: HAMP domain-containing histidine kinase [Chloroflexi bacterium]|nr:HAMP domain-containing histidine kinase [Chloroflexota bacterium]